MSPRTALVTAVVLLLVTSCTAETARTTSSTTSSTTGSSSTSPSTTSSSTTSTTVAASLPENAQDYATAAFDAWMADDGDRLNRLLTGEAMEALDEADLDPSAGWRFARCEGAAGSVYCTWESEEGRLTLRVGNQAASAGEEGAIQEVLTE